MGEQAERSRVVVPQPEAAEMGTIVAFVAATPRRPGPELLFDDPRRIPDGAFVANAIANGCLRVGLVPPEGSPWDAVEEFALTYDGYAYWSGLGELATRALQSWTRYGSLPDDLDELRACLFFEARRWHHFGGDPRGRAASYAADLLAAITTAVAAGEATADLTSAAAG